MRKLLILISLIPFSALAGVCEGQYECQQQSMQLMQQENERRQQEIERQNERTQERIEQETKKHWEDSK